MIKGSVKWEVPVAIQEVFVGQDFVRRSKQVFEFPTVKGIGSVRRLFVWAGPVDSVAGYSVLGEVHL